MSEQSQLPESVGPNPRGRLTPLTQLLGTLGLGAVLVVSLVFVLVGFQLDSLALSLGFYLVASALTLMLFRRGYPHTELGSGNLVTLFRLVLVSGLVSAATSEAYPWLVVVIATCSLVLDGVDGYLARKEGRVSDFGARLDMEVDTALALVLAVVAWSSGLVGIWVLLLALPRYLFVLAARALPWLWAQLPYSLARRVVSVLQITSLIVINAPLFGGILAIPVAVIAAGLLAWSFGRDVIWLYRARS